ncbi:hypothetical protein [Pseudomonas sp. efr-133-TYG-103a]|uniref:hypothetical protein n=1 Tax=Pseudomonas sp. efr-133-TYG-103a TaxID=3040308 RepID=UPI002552468A|nr:hypothetical protein [Pseudomonas sp. efr-133-TYG-103a]
MTILEDACAHFEGLRASPQNFFGMKAHRRIGADAESGLVHHVHGTAANVAD